MTSVFQPVFSRSLFRRWVLPASMVIAAVLTATVTPASAQIYVGERDGDVDTPLVLSNFSSSETPQLIVAPLVAAPHSSIANDLLVTADVPALSRQSSAAVGSIRTAPAVPAHLLPIFVSVAHEQSVPASLLMAVAAAESGFNARAVSPKGALGLMQLMPETARQHGVHQVWSVLDNVRGGAAHLRQLIKRFSGQQALALAAYNAGAQAVLNAGSQIPPFDETQHYVPKVLAWQSQYEKVAERLPTGVHRERRERESRAVSPVPERRFMAMQDAPRTMRLP
jgi:hypothetical protein